MIDVLVPCYKRPEYTKQCLEYLERNTKYPNVTFFLVDDGSQDATLKYFEKFNLPKRIFSHKHNTGLRDVIIDFLNASKADYICKIDNDVLVPKEWLTKLVHVYESTNVDVLSPNVMPSDAASKGLDVGGYFETRTIGGLWFMDKSLLDDMFFEKLTYGGIKCAHMLIDQIQTDLELNVGWTKDVTVDDIGHWSGKHNKHIKSQEHLDYTMEIGREVAW